MTDQMIALSIDIQAYEDERIYLSRIIQTLDAEIVKDKDKESLIYMHEIIERYKVVIDKIRILLECFFSEEANAGLPTNFLYRKYYKRIKTAL